MKTIANNWRYLLAGLYTWIITTFFGAILLDIVYSNIASRALEPSETEAVFSQVSDFLLLIGMFLILASIGAIGSSWSVGSARNLFITSLLITGIEFL